MIRRAYLHIGGEKTGTTTLQSFLTRNAPLLKKAGYYYPCEIDNIGFEGNGHFPVAAALLDREAEFISPTRAKTLSSVLSDLTRRCAEVDDTLILSCEHFSSRIFEPGPLRVLRDALPTDDVKIVFYAREPADLALAGWSTYVIGGGRKRLRADEVEPSCGYFNHLRTLDLWAEVFGQENVIAREYKRDRLIGCDIRKDFCHLLGVDAQNAEFEKDQNETPNLLRLEVLRTINEALPMFDESPHGWRETQNLRSLIAACVPEGGSVKSLMTARDADVVKAKFSAVNHELNERYFGGQLSRSWFPSDEFDSVGAGEKSEKDEVDLVPILRDTIIRVAELAERQNQLSGNAAPAADTARQDAPNAAEPVVEPALDELAIGPFRVRRRRGTKRKLKQMLQTMRVKLRAGSYRKISVR